MNVQPYLFFEGRCDEAIEFYQNALGAEVEMILRYKDGPEGPGCPPGPGMEEKVMHCSLRIRDAVVLASDGMCGGNPEFKGISLAIYGRDVADSAQLFTALADGGQVQMPLEKTFFSPSFGMVTDRFGVTWMVVTPPEGETP